MKKYINILLFVAVIIVILLVIFFVSIQDPSYDKTQNLSKEDVQSVLDKSLELDNVYIKHTSDIDIANNILYLEYYLKDDMIKKVVVAEDGSKTISQKNIKQSKWLDIHEDKKLILKLTRQDGNNTGYINLSDSNYFKYLGKTKINDRDVIAIKIREDEKFMKEIFYIDEETGIVIKNVVKLSFITLEEETREFEIGNVTDEDVAWIDFETEYPDFEYIEMD